MNISELKIGQGKVNVEGVISEVGDTRTFNKFGRDLKVATAVLKDDSGAIKLTLWNDDINLVKNGAKIKVTNGFVNEFNGEKQLTSGKFGKLEVVEGEEEEKKEEIEELKEEKSEEQEPISDEEAI